MIICFVHEMLNRFIAYEWSNTKKYFLTFLSGGGLHLILFLLLQYLARDTNNMLIELFYKFYVVFVLADLFIMAILYKLYWGHSIVDNTPQIYLPEEEGQYSEYGNYFPKEDSVDSFDQIRRDIYERAGEDREKDSDSSNEDIYEDDIQEDDIQEDDMQEDDMQEDDVQGQEDHMQGDDVQGQEDSIEDIETGSQLEPRENAQVSNDSKEGV